MTSTTDNRTTELRRLLDERGIEYQEFHGQAAGSMEPFKRFYIDGRTQAIIETASHTDDVLLTLRCTPEQAIAATLGSGTLTAEQVCEAAHGHYELRMVRDVDGLDVPQVVFDWQAIADELNAELGCEREIELGDALSEVAEKWAIAQVEAEDCAKRCMLLEQLVRDMYDVAARGEFDVGEESKFSERMTKLGVVYEC